MNSLLIFFVVCSFLWVFSQFGSRLSAQRALLWWIVFAFVSVATIDPQIYEGIVKLLGIQVTSNFILGALVFFCLLQLLEESASQTKNLRLIREIVTTQAAQRFLSALPKKPIRVVVVLPTFNEAQSLPALVSPMENLRKALPDVQICFVDDGSKDKTAETLNRLFPEMFCSHMANLGVSAALLTGFKIATSLNADWVVQCDSDGQHPPEEIPKLVSEIEKSQADLLIASRYLNPEFKGVNRESSTSGRRFGGKLISTTLKILFGTSSSVSDPTSGFKVYSKRAVGLFTSFMPDDYPEAEIIALAALAGLKIEERPMVMRKRLTGQSSIAGFRSAQFMIKVMTSLIGFRLRSFSLMMPIKNQSGAQT